VKPFGDDQEVWPQQIGWHGLRLRGKCRDLLFQSSWLWRRQFGLIHGAALSRCGKLAQGESGLYRRARSLSPASRTALNTRILGDVFGFVLHQCLRNTADYLRALSDAGRFDEGAQSKLDETTLERE
jgi:hypothetical protein